MENKTVVVKNLKEKSVLVSTTFNAPLEKVWRAFTDSALLEKWWAPVPWEAKTKTMNFTVGGHWLYSMVNPENEKHWGVWTILPLIHNKALKSKTVFAMRTRIQTLPCPFLRVQLLLLEPALALRLSSRWYTPLKRKYKP